MVVDMGSGRHVCAGWCGCRGGLLENGSRSSYWSWGRGKRLHWGRGSWSWGHVGPHWSRSRGSLLENRSRGRGGYLAGSIVVVARFGGHTANHGQGQDKEFLQGKIEIE